MSVLMACGDMAHGTDGTGHPVCVVHAGGSRDTEARTVAPDPDLTGRKSKCGSCSRVENSDGTREDGTRLWKGAQPFLALNPAHDGVTVFDSHYDGCRGWD